MARILLSSEGMEDLRGNHGAQLLALADARGGLDDQTATSLLRLGECNLAEIDVEYDPDLGALWCYQVHSQRPNFTTALIDDVKTVQETLRYGLQEHHDPDAEDIRACQYLVWASRRSNIFNLGGDLIYFVELLNKRDRAAMSAYAKSCIEICYQNHINMDLPITTVSLACGDALGGGLESLLSSDIVVAEKSAQFGFPEILFNLFPGMGAYSFVARRAGPKIARDLVFSGRIYRGEQLYEMGLVDVLAPDGEGEATLCAYLSKHKRKIGAHRALHNVRRQIEQVSYGELDSIADIWVDAAMALGESDLKKMRRLANAQMARLEREEDERAAINTCAPIEPATTTPKSSANGSVVAANLSSTPAAPQPKAEVVPILNTSLKPVYFGKRSAGAERMDQHVRGATGEEQAVNDHFDNDRAGQHGGPNVYGRILEEVAEARAAATLQPGVERLLSEGMSQSEYLEFLEQLYHVVWHFCPTMAAAAARCGDDMRELRYALYHQIEEEKGHETWVLDDAVAMGATVEQITKSTPAVPVRALIGYNYYVAERGNPWAVLGMVHVLEEISANYSGRVANAVANRLGITDGRGFRFLGSHGVMDVCHVNSFKGLVENVKSEEDIDAIVQASEVNFALFGALFRDA